MSAKVLVVADESYREAVLDALRGVFELIAAGASDALPLLEGGHFDVIVLAATGAAALAVVRAAQACAERTRLVCLPEVGLEGAPAALQPDALQRAVERALPFHEAAEAARAAGARRYLVALLREYDGNVTRAAERAGVERENLHRLLRRFSLRAADFRAPDGPRRPGRRRT